MKIKINDKEYIVEVAETEDQKETGLQNMYYLPEDEGMLFVYDEPEDVGFWMEDTYIPLDIIFINEDQEVISVKQGKPEDNTLIEEENVLYVVELNSNSGVNAGDQLEFLDDDEYVMSVLKQDGTSQMELKGGERIVSRKETKVLIRKAKKALDSHSDNDYKSLGKYIFKVFKKQDSREPDYVKNPK